MYRIVRTFARVLGVTLGVILMWVSLVQAQDVVRTERTIRMCTPGTINGSQVFENAWEDGRCVDGYKMLVRLYDFELRMLCSMALLQCTRYEDLDTDGRAHVAFLEQYRTPAFTSKVCTRTVTQNERVTHVLEMHTGAEVDCLPDRHAVRSYDYVQKRACVHVGGKILGCREIPADSRVVTN